MRPVGGRVVVAGFTTSCLLLIIGWQQWRLSGLEGTLSRLSRVLLEERKNISSSASVASPASAASAASAASGTISAALSDDSITRDCITWTPLPTQYSAKQGANKLSSKIEKGVTESDLHRKESFEKIWSANAWGKETKSGPGSLLKNTNSMRRVLDRVVNKVKMTLKKESVTLLDSSCGDMAWMPTFLENRTDVVFTGYDIVPGNVEGHQKKFSTKPWKFEVHDIVADPIGKYDIILSRHTLQHLKTGDIERVIANFVKSGSNFLLTTNFPRTKTNRELSEETQYRYRPVNLLLEPYFLPTPMCSSLDIKEENIHIDLWDLERIRSQRGEKL